MSVNCESIGYEDRLILRTHASYMRVAWCCACCLENSYPLGNPGHRVWHTLATSVVANYALDT